MSSEEKLDSERSRLSISVNMIGINLAIFTFVLLLFFSQNSYITFNHILFQISLVTMLAADFAFGVSAIYSNVLIYSKPSKHPDVQTHVNRSISFFTLGLFLLFLEPTLILFAVSLYFVAIAALIFYFIYLILYFKEDSTIRKLQSSH